MGFNIELIAVVNPNDIVHRTFKFGDLSMAKDVTATWASAMDIQVRNSVFFVWAVSGGSKFFSGQGSISMFERFGIPYCH